MSNILQMFIHIYLFIYLFIYLCFDLFVFSRSLQVWVHGTFLLDSQVQVLGAGGGVYPEGPKHHAYKVLGQRV